MLLIANPRAGGSRGRKVLKEAERILKSKGVKFDSKLTEKSSPAERSALKGGENFEKVVAIGGDGTINKVAQGLVKTDVSLGIIPAGTANDFVKSLNIPEEIGEALDLICSESGSKIDVGKVSSANGSRYFVNIFGLGFDAQVAKDVELAEYHQGLAGFALNALRELPNFKERPISISHRSETASVLMVMVANGKRAGKYFRIAPDADLRDGKLNFLVVEQLSLLRRVECLLRACLGHHESMPEVHSEQMEKVEIDVPHRWPAQVDGEPVELNGTIEIEVVPRSLKVISNKPLE